MATSTNTTKMRGWVEIPGYPGYQAHPDGKIRNKKTQHETYGGVSGRYRRVSVYPQGAKRPVLAYTHDLICTAFHGERPKGHVVLHKNDDRLDCSAANLRWGTQAENIKDVWKNGLRGSQESLRLGYPLYLLTFDPHLPETLTPRSPYIDDTSLDTDGTDVSPWPYPEPTTPRVSFSTTVEGCYRAIYPNVVHLFTRDHYPHVDMYLYQATLTDDEEVIEPNTLTREQWVWDAHVTQEHWVMSPVKVKLIGRYRFYNQVRNPSLITHPFGDRRLKDTGTVGPSSLRYRELPWKPGLESLTLSW